MTDQTMASRMRLPMIWLREKRISFVLDSLTKDVANSDRKVRQEW
jgi:hypothetical protein